MTATKYFELGPGLDGFVFRIHYADGAVGRIEFSDGRYRAPLLVARRRVAEILGKSEDYLIGLEEAQRLRRMALLLPRADYLEFIRDFEFPWFTPAGEEPAWRTPTAEEMAQLDREWAEQATKPVRASRRSAKKRSKKET